MTTSDELADVILMLGDDEELTESVRRDILDKLVELGWIRVEVDSAPVLTEEGQKIYRMIIDGSDVPELEFGLPEGE
jgi:hypothetical protein